MIPSLFNEFPVSDDLRKLLALPWKLGGIGIISSTKNANDECNNSRELTSQLTSSIKQQERCYIVSEENIKIVKNTNKKETYGQTS